MPGPLRRLTPPLLLPTLLLLALPLLALRGAAVELLTENDPPHNMLRDGKVVGVATDKLAEAFRRVGAAYKISLMPWARAYEIAARSADACVFSAGRTAEREAAFQWVGPVAEQDWILYARADQVDKPAKLEDVRKDAVGGYLQDIITLWLQARGFQVQAAASDAVNPRKLMLGRIKYWASSKSRAGALLEDENLAASVVPLFTFGHTELYLACNPRVPSALVQKLNDALVQMKEDGTIAKIEARYAK